MRLVPSLVLGIAAVVSALLLASGLKELRTGDRYVTVKGVAEQEVVADLALWPIRFVAASDQLAQAQADIGKSREAIHAFLALHGIDRAKVELQRLDVTDTAANPYQNSEVANRFIISQTLLVRSGDIERIRGAAQAVGELVDAGVILSSDYGPSGPTYIFNGLNGIKPGMIAQATAAAREAAEQFARDAEATLGGLRRANQGVFQILARDRAAGITEESQPAKTVRVVSTLEYYLED